MSIITESLTLETLQDYVDLSKRLVSQVDEMPVESREHWRHELMKNLERVVELRDDFLAAHRETTYRDRVVVMMAIGLSQNFLRVKKRATYESS